MHTTSARWSRPDRRRLPFVLIALGTLSACGVSDTSPIAVETSSTSAATTTSEAEPVPTTTTIPVVLDLTKLPLVESPSSPSDDIAFMQRLLTALCCQRADDGIWGPKTDESITELRTSLGLRQGGLDADLWARIFNLPPPVSLEPQSIAHGLTIPASAVYLDDDVAAWAPSFTARYILPFNAGADEIVRWVRNNNSRTNSAGWNWCEELSLLDIRPLQMFWWKSPDRTLSLEVSSWGAGRVELLVAVDEETDLFGCEGYE